MHSVLFVHIALYPKTEIRKPLSHGNKSFLRLFFLCSLRKKILKIISLFIFRLESHGFLGNHVFLPSKQAGTIICYTVCQDINFEICLSLFVCKELKMYKQHIVQWG